MLVQRTFKLFRWQPIVNLGNFLSHTHVNLSNGLQSKKKNFNATRRIKQLINDGNCKDTDDLIQMYLLCMIHWVDIKIASSSTNC